jgi:hypothetical protein
MKNYLIKTNVPGDSSMPYLGTEFRQSVRKAIHKLKHKFDYRLKVYDMTANVVYEYVIWFEKDTKGSLCWAADKKVMFSIKNEAKEREALLKSIQSVDINLKYPDYDWMHNYTLADRQKSVLAKKGGDMNVQEK